MRIPNHPAVTVVTVGALLAAGAAIVAPPAGAAEPAPACTGGVCRVTYDYAGGEPATFTVPDGVNRVDLLVEGASGGDAGRATGGAGAVNSTAVTAEPGNVFQVVVGGAGSPDGGASAGGGGSAGSGSSGDTPDAAAASGGGGSFVYRGESAVSVAAGGGGAVDDGTDYADGGNAGIAGSEAEPGGGPDGGVPPTGAAALTPGSAGTNDAGSGTAGTASSPDSPVGVGGDGGSADPAGAAVVGGAGGGGGYAGGGGGAPGQSGAGGSSYYASDFGGSSTTDSQGNRGDGSVTLSYDDPGAVTGTTLVVSPLGNDLTTIAPVTLTATVSARYATADGTVSFRDLLDDTLITDCVAVPVVNGIATCAATSLRIAGSHRVRAEFTGTEVRASQSPPLRYTVIAVPVFGNVPLPAGRYGQQYSQVLAATGSTAPYTFTLVGGTKLPAGLTLDADGTIHGTPTAASDQPVVFTVRVTDSQAPARSTDRAFTIAVGRAGPGNPDFVLTPTKPVVGGTYRLSITRGASAAPFEITGNDNCTVTGQDVQFVHAGTCTVTGTQDGDANHDAADPVSRSVTVGQGTPDVAVTLSTGAGAVYGQPVTATASSTVTGTLSFALNGETFTSGVQVAPGQPATVAVPALAVGPATVVASFTPAATAADDWTVTSAQAGVAVTAAASTVDVAATPTALRASVGVTAPGSVIPTGTVTFAVDGTTVGTAAVSDGVAELAYALAAGAHTVTASYGGRSEGGAVLVSPSVGTAHRTDPMITAMLSSAATRSTSGWYAAPVTVTFTCTAGTAPIDSCPAPVTVSAAGQQTVSGTATATDGGTRTLAVPVAVDRTAPTAPVVGGVVAGRIYPATVPAGSCVSRDVTSGLASCTVIRTISGITITWTATATDRAGNVSRTVVQAARSIVLVSGADYRAAVPVVRGGRAYTLVVTGAARPTVVTPVLAPGRPTKAGKAFAAAGRNRWTLAVTFPKANASRPVWNLGIRIGSVTTVVAVKVVR